MVPPGGTNISKLPTAIFIFISSPLPPPSLQVSSAAMESYRVKNLNKLTIGHLNINSLRNKFELLTHQTKDNIDILMISETKLDESFPKSQFFMKGFSSTHRLNRNCNGGGILLYIREDIPSKLLSIERDLT